MRSKSTEESVCDGRGFYSAADKWLEVKASLEISIII